jgi:hypothetical protein
VGVPSFERENVSISTRNLFSEQNWALGSTTC